MRHNNGLSASHWTRLWLRILRSDFPGLSGWALHTMTSILMREKQKEIRLTHKRGRQCDQEAETGVKQPQAKECQQPLEARRKNRFSPQFSSIAQSCPTLCDPMNCSTPGLPVHHQLPEFTQTHVHRVGDAIQPSHPLSSPSLLTFSLYQHQGLFQWISSLHQVAKVLEFQCQHQSFHWIFRTLGSTSLISLQSKGLSRVFSSTTVQKHQFFSAQLSL